MFGLLVSPFCAQDLLAESAVNMLADIGPAALLRLLNLLGDRKRGLGNALRVGTGCSGTDVVVRSLQVLSESCKSKYSLEFEFEHIYSIENSKDAIAFIRDTQQPQYIFNDMLAFGANGRGTDVLSGKTADLPGVDLFIAGTECDSISSLNRHAASSRDCVKDETGKTGTTLKAALSIVGRGKPCIVIFENVKALAARSKDGSSNLQALTEQLNSLGYCVSAKILQAGRASNL